MRKIAVFAFGLLLAGCGGGVSCVSTDPETGEEICTTDEYASSCPDGTTQVESCDGYN